MKCFTLGVAVMLASASYAADPWSLEQCVDYAMAHNIKLKQQVVAVEVAQEDVSSSKAQLFPSLSFATNHNVSWRPWSESFVNLENGTMTSTSSETNYNGTYGISAQWTVWNGGRNRKQVQRSRVAQEQAELEQQTTAATIQEQIAQYYVQILYQTEAVKVNQQILESTLTQLSRAEEMYAVGAMSKADLAQMQAQAGQDRYNVVNAQTMLDQYKLQLKQILEIDNVDPLEVAIPDIADADVMWPLPSRTEAYQAALACRPEIMSSQAAIKAADIDVSIAKRGYLPSLSMMAGINTSNSSGMNDSWANQWKRNLNNSIGLTLSVPIFDNRQNKTNVAKARLAKETSQLNLDAAKMDLFNDIESFWLNAYNAQQQFTAAVANVEAMQESYRLVSEQFSVGLKDIVDLTTGKNNLIQAEQQMLQSKYTALLNMALLRFYSGNQLSLN